MRLAYLGTPEMAVPPLRALVAAGHEVVLVVTRADRRRGRGSAASPSPVKAAALELGIPVTDDIEQLLGIDAELGVVVAYGRIIKPHVLAHLPMVNVHFSLLPRWRGAAPVERALLAGDDVTGVCIMDVEEGLDTGGVHARRELPIGPTTTADDLRRDLVAIGTELLLDVLSRPLGTGRAAGRRRDVRREDHARRAAARLVAARRRARPGRARRRGVDDVPRPAPQGPRGDPDAVDRGGARVRWTPTRPPSARPPAASASTPCSPRARPRWPGARSPTAPTRPRANISAPRGRRFTP